MSNNKVLDTALSIIDKNIHLGYKELAKKIYAETGRVSQALRFYPKLCSTFEDWLIKYTSYQPFDAGRHSFVDRKAILKYNTQPVFDLHDNESYTKCVIEFISGMTDQFAIQVYEEIITF